eukprot:CAMPEP_0113919368 /NCGR_PEP_ID=MMETSP0780_2-20120614/33873_1 /TAXON_ID=652834 /ORGANISM="Palpitomonas bilix" /LENGTH=1127 /DNA_ID=CAMNT_0000919289 /DNA_START=136 /DNA_END=3519 /DNA_ORIENTATION=- /assembly_acc=CAM_ASM_000599
MNTTDSDIRHRYRGEAEGDDIGMDEVVTEEEDFTQNHLPSFSFKPGSFKYRWRVLLPLLPCFVVATAIGGRAVVSLSAWGFAAAYAFHAVEMYSASLYTGLAFGGAVCASVYFQGYHLASYSVLNLLFLNFVSLGMVLLAMLGLIESPYLQFKFPNIALMMERLLVTFPPVPIAACVGWTVFASTGADAVPICLSATLFCLLLLYAKPFSSSFLQVEEEDGRGVGEKERERRSAAVTSREMEDWGQHIPLVSDICKVGGRYIIVGKAESMVMVGGFVFIPAIAHVGIHWGSFSTFEDIMELVLLVYAPLALLVLFREQGTLWWIGVPEDMMKVLATLFLWGSLLVSLFAFEVRVIFHSFSHLILLPRRIAYVVVTGGLFSAFGMLFVSNAGVLPPNLARLSNFALSTVAALSLHLVLGVKWYFIPVPLIGAFCGTLFMHNRKPIFFMVTVSCATAMLGLYLQRSLWKISFYLHTPSLGPVSMRELVLFLALCFVMGLLLPGVIAMGVKARDPKKAIAALLPVYSISVAVAEVIMMSATLPMYSSIYVVVTSVGFFITSILLVKHKLLMKAPAFVVFCTSMSKLSIIVNSDFIFMLETFVLVLTFAGPHFDALFSVLETGKKVEKKKRGEENIRLDEDESQNKSFRAIALSIAPIAILMLSRSTFVEEMLKVFTGTHSSPPSSTVWMVTLLITSANTLLNFVLYVNTMLAVRGAAALGVVAASFFLFVEPDSRDLTSSEAVGFIFGIAAAVCAIASVLLRRARSGQILRVLLYALSALFIGLSCSGLVGIRNLSLGELTTILHFSTPFWLMVTCLVVTDPRLTQPNYRLVLALIAFGAAYLIVSVFMLPTPPFDSRDGANARKARQGDLLVTHAVANVVVALACRVRVILLEGKKEDVRGQYRAKDVEDEDEYIRESGNLSAFLAFGQLVIHHFVFADSMSFGQSDSSSSLLNIGDDLRLLLYPALLLLLSKDSHLLPWYTPARRFFLPFVAMISALYFVAVLSIFGVIGSDVHVVRYGSDLSSLFGKVTNMLEVLSALPSHVTFALHLFGPADKGVVVRHGRRVASKETRRAGVSFYQWILVLPLNLLPLAFGGMPAVRLIGAMGVAVTTFGMLAVWRKKRSSRRLM